MDTVFDMMKALWNNGTYILAIALQLSAGLLLIGNTQTKRDGIIKAYCAQNRAIGFDENGKLIDLTGLKDVIKTTWINKIAFLYLFAGYLIGVFGEISINRVNVLIIVIFVMIPLIIIPFKIAKYKTNTFGTITIDDIPNKQGVMYVIVDDEESQKENK